GIDANIGAPIGVDLVGIVAFFAGLGDPIAAARQRAAGGTRVAWRPVLGPVVTALFGVDLAVAAFGTLAQPAAAVGVDRVAVVALLVVGGHGHAIGAVHLHDAVTTAGFHAGAEAGVAVVLV